MSTPTTLYVNARFLDEPVTGVQRWASAILSQFDSFLEEGRIDPERWKIVLLAPRSGHPIGPFRHLELRRAGVLRSHLWEQVVLPRLARGPLLNLKNTAPLRHPWTALQLHDAAVFASPEGYSRAFLAWYRFLVPRVARRAKVLTTLSRHGAEEISRWTGIPVERFTILGCGHEHIFACEADPTAFRRLGLRKNQYLLAVSSLNPNKNFAAAANAMRRADLDDKPLVIVGGSDRRVFAESGIPLPENAKLAGRLSDGELRYLYENALGLLFPSHYEGFGLPPLEAMALGCPVICSDRSALPEVGGESVLYCDPSDEADIARKIVRLVEDPPLRQTLSGLGRAQANRFTWRKSAELLWDALRPALEDQRGVGR